MPKASRYMYQCSECGEYMAAKDRVKLRVILTKPKSKKQYDADLCPSCEAKVADGKDLQEVWKSKNQDSDDEPDPKVPGNEPSDHRTPKTGSTGARRMRPAKDANTAPGHRARSTTSDAR